MTVQNYILQQPSPHQEIMAILRSWILDLGPHTTEKISYTLPYFYFFGQVCYLHPDTDSVALCFTKGYQLSDEQKILQSKGRKQVRSITFHSGNRRMGAGGSPVVERGGNYERISV